MALVASVAGIVNPFSASAAGGASATIDQCTNGPVGPPISPQPCVGSNAAAVSAAIPGINGGASTSYKNWVNGNANGSKAHWREGEFIPYRTIISGLTAGTTHTLVWTFDTVSSGRHAIDYLGSFDSTETTSTATQSSQGTIIHADNNNPCSDLVAAGEFPWACTPSTPQSVYTFPSVQFTGTGGETGCGGSPGSFAGTQAPGTVDLFGPTGSAITSVTYPTQNAPSGTGSCSTTVQVTFTVSQAVSSSQSVVLAWGGHIASAVDWGFGNSASAINGSPYHMALTSLDGASTGSQDRALQTSAIFFTPTIATQVMVNGSPLSGEIPLGSTVNDTATLTDEAPSAGGTVTYSLFPNLSCSGTASHQYPVTVSGGVVPNSPSFSPTAGNYSYQAAYGGDGIDLATTSACEPFTVGPGVVSLSTTVFDAATNAALASPAPLGTSVYDTTTLTQTTGVTPTGTVTYTFFESGDCTTGTVVGTPQQVTIASDGSVPHSNPTGPLTGADSPYAYQVSYSGDTNYVGGTSSCEPFAVAKGSTAIDTTVFNAASNTAIASPVALGTSVYDTATVTGPAGGPTPTGTVTYTFYSGGNCSTGTPVGSPQTVILDSSGNVPHSAANGPLTAAGGPYAYQAAYSGDSNYTSGTSDCEPFAVGMGAATLTTTVFDAATNMAAPSPVLLGSTVYDTASLTSTAAGATPTGTVTYTFFSSGNCTTGTVVGTPDTVTVGAGASVPNSGTQGPLTAADSPYAFQASYSGDANFVSGTSDCEPFTVQKGSAALDTTVFDAATNTAASSPVQLGSSVYDTSTLTPSVGGITPTGTVTYTFFDSGDCTTGTVVGTPDMVTVASNGSVPHSSTEGPLNVAQAPYAFRAAYSGDSNYVAGSSGCEPFTVGQGAAAISTTVFNAATNNPITSPVPLGTSVYDTTTLTGTTGVVPTGTVTYTFFDSGDCTTGTVVGTPDMVTVGSGASVPHSGTEGPLDAQHGPYAFRAAYSGDSNYVAGTSDCEPFAVAQGSAELTTSVFDASTNAPIANPVPLGASVYDTASLTTTVSSATPTGTVTYTFFDAGDCTTGTVVGTDMVTVGSGASVPHSTTDGPLTVAGGPYAYQASYSGDANFMAGTSGCEPFAVGKSFANLATTVYDAPSGTPLVGAAPLGDTVYDTSTLTHTSSVVPTGTVTYTFFRSGNCTTGTVVGTDVVTLASDGSVPDSSTSAALTASDSPYAYQASYSGDTNYVAGTSGCEPFSVGMGAATLTTTVFDAATNEAISSPVAFGTSVYDTSTLTTTTSVVPTGTVTYTFFSKGDCSTGTVVGTDVVTLASNGSVPHSSTDGPLTAADGPYAYEASYSGDANFVAGVSDCEPFAVAQTSASLATTVFDASSNQAITSPVPLGTTVYDTATLTTSSSVVPTGTVTYTFFRSGDCTTGTVVGTDGVTLTSNGSVPHSSTDGPLTAAGGPYAYEASYSGDANFVAGTSDCEPFGVGQGAASLSTTVFDAAHNEAISSPVALGTTVYDTASLTTTAPGATPTGTVTYTFFSSGDCTTGTIVGSPDTVTVGSGASVPHSGTDGPLTASDSPYAYQASYSGDANFVAGTSDCEPFTVAPGAVSLSTTVFDAATNEAIASPVPLGTSVYDTSTLTAGGGPTPTGTVTYRFYSSGDCTTGTLVGSPDTVTVGAGASVPHSGTDGPLDAANGPYAYQATYSGDTNYVTGVSGCEPFAVAQGAANLTTTVFDATTNEPISNPVALGSSVYDTATLTTTAGGAIPTGTVTYTFFSSGDCTTGTIVGSPDTVTVGAGASVPHSGTDGPLTAADGPYAYQASYSGDANFIAGASGCEPFSVGKGAASLTTTVFDAATNQAVSGPEPLGSSVYDTALLTDSGGVTPTGTVTYTFFSKGDCTTGTVVGSPQTVTVGAGGSVPDSSTTGPLDAANSPDAFEATYSGDANLTADTSACEPFSVGQGAATLTTTVFDATSNTAVSGPEPLGSSVYDTAQLTGSGGVTPTGTVTYTFFSKGDCSTGTVVGSPQTVTVGADGSVPNSNTTGPLVAGDSPYAFEATYSGDANLTGVTSACEPFSVGKGTASLTTTVFDAVTGQAAVSPLPFDVSVYDTSTLTSATAGVTPTGTVTYTFFSGGDCTTGTVVGTPETVTVGSGGVVPHSATQGPLDATAGPYAFRASYSGDGNLGPVTSGCEPFTVSQANVVLTPTISTALSASSVAVGAAVQDSATLHGAASNASGTVTYTAYSDAQCMTKAQSAGTVTVTAGSVPDSQSVSFAQAGTYYFQAVYSGDAGDQSATSPCTAEVLTVAATPTTTTTTTPPVVPVAPVQTGTAWVLTHVAWPVGVIVLLAAGLAAVAIGRRLRRRSAGHVAR